MRTTAKCLAEAAFATNADGTIYTAPASTRTIIDKFTVTNTDGSTQTINVNIVPSGGSVGASNLILDTASITTLVTRDCTELQNQILETGDVISVKASVNSKVVVRVSGRETT